MNPKNMKTYFTDQPNVYRVMKYTIVILFCMFFACSSITNESNEKSKQLPNPLSKKSKQSTQTMIHKSKNVNSKSDEVIEKSFVTQSISQKSFLTKDIVFQQASVCALPDKGMVYEASTFENNTFQIERKFFSEEIIQQVKNLVYSCKLHVEMRIKLLKEKISQRIEQKSIIESKRNIIDIINRHKTLKNEMVNIQSSFHEFVQNQDLLGMFAVVVEASDPYTNAEKLIAAGRHFLGVQSIKALSGELLTSKTWLTNNDYYSQISVKSSGIFRIHTIISKDQPLYFNNKTQFVYSAMIKVSPLKQHLKIHADFPDNIKNCCVVNLLTENWDTIFRQALKKHTDITYATRTIKKLSKQANHWQRHIENYNKQVFQSLENKKKQFERQLSIKNDEILKTRIEIDEARKVLNSIYDQIGIPKTNNPETQLENAIAKANRDINYLYNEIIDHKNQILEIREDPVQAFRDPKKEIRQKAYDIYQLMKENHSKQEISIKESVVLNGVLANDTQKSQLNMIRVPKQVHLYPFLKAGQIHVLLVIRFSMLESKKQDDACSKNTYISNLCFIDPTSGGSMMLTEAGTLIDRVVTNAIRKFDQQNLCQKYNYMGHAIENSDANVNHLVYIVFDSILSPFEKSQKIIDEIMEPYGIDALITGQYIDKGQVIDVIPVILIKTDNYLYIEHEHNTFPKDEFLCSDPNNPNVKVLCRGASEYIWVSVHELLLKTF